MQPVSRIVSFADCGREAYILKSDDDPPRYRVAGSSCHDRFCDPCATERSRVIAQNVIDRLGTTRARFITFTIRHDSEPLAELVDKLYGCFRRLQKTRLWREHVEGGVAFLEVKYSERSDGWHPHLHVLAHGKYIKKACLQSTWAVITGGSFVVDIRLAGGSERIARYVTKYASKPLNTSFVYSPSLLDEAIVALKGRRLCCTFGGWRGVLLVDKPDEGGWTNIGPLASFIDRAIAGDSEAVDLLRQVDAQRLQICLDLRPVAARPPPERKPNGARQLALIDVAPLDPVPKRFKSRR